MAGLMLVLAAGTTLFALYKLVLYPFLLSPLAPVPAIHPLAKITSLYILWLRVTHRENAVVVAAHRKYGEVVRLGPNELSVNCVENGVKTIYGKGFDKPHFYSVFDEYGRTCLFSSLDSRTHAAKKRRISHIYSKSYLLSSPAVGGLVRELVRADLLPRLCEAAEAKDSLDTMGLHRAVAMDFSTAYFFGLKNGTRHINNERSRLEWYNAYTKSRPLATQVWHHEVPSLGGLLERFGLIPVSECQQTSWDTMDALILAMCDGAERTLSDPHSHSASPENHPCVYQHLKIATDKESFDASPSIVVESFSTTRPKASVVGDVEKWRLRSDQQLEIAAELLDQCLAAHDTMATTLTFVCWELSRHPAMQERLRAELRTLGGGVRVHVDCPLPSAGALDALPYLHAILMETMRLHPAVAGAQPRLTPHDKMTTIGQFGNIPGGVRVQSSACCLHQNPDVFPDPSTFRPERWLLDAEGGEGEGGGRKERWFWAFGSGSRMCVGSNFAMLIMKHVVMAMYANFETHIIDDDGIEQWDAFIAPPVSDRLIIGVRAVA